MQIITDVWLLWLPDKLSSSFTSSRKCSSTDNLWLSVLITCKQWSSLNISACEKCSFSHSCLPVWDAGRPDSCALCYFIKVASAAWSMFLSLQFLRETQYCFIAHSHWETSPSCPLWRSRQFSRQQTIGDLGLGLAVAWSGMYIMSFSTYAITPSEKQPVEIYCTSQNYWEKAFMVARTILTPHEYLYLIAKSL